MYLVYLHPDIHVSGIFTSRYTCIWYIYIQIYMYLVYLHPDIHVSGHPEGSIEMREKYRNFNKSLKKLIKPAKYSYYSKKFVNCNGNMKKTW